ncbi:hypothetical protein [Paenibacillus sp. OAS669]|uniref:hypothetical protein n=1 Tax=Paenibacillus sp. OAS669 TaxID=2663821 RepID=UPI001789C8E1|nr:hypothetical protein [Paenibacillus sp. OAS669]MBE1447356.1 hypothetical protein [Paenibacillus sp. OAS669]
MKTNQWKRRLTHTSLLAAMLTMAIGGAGSAFAADANDQKETQTPAVLAQPAVTISTFAVGGGSNLLMQPALQRNYLKLLAATYAPETLGEWKQALDERKQVESELPKPQMTKSITMTKKAVESGTGADGAETADSSKKRQMVRIVLPGSSDKQSSEAAVIVKEGDDAVMKEVIQALPVEVKDANDIIKAELPDSFKRQQKLAEAVEADDAATIRSLLPELLKDYKSETESLRKLSKEIEAAAIQPAQENEESK